MFERYRKLNLPGYALVGLLALLFSMSVLGQNQKAPVPAPKPKPKKPVKAEIVEVVPPEAPAEVAINDSGLPAEAAIEVSTKVIINLTVSKGGLRINGWDRSEVRAYVEGGSEVGFTVLQKEKSTGKAQIVKIVGYNPKDKPSGQFDDALSGDVVEIDVPRRAIVKVKVIEDEAVIESVEKVEVVSLNGDISLANITNGVTVKSFHGDVVLRNVNGSINAENTIGSISVVGGQPVELSDNLVLRSSSGALGVSGVGHLQVNLNSTSGTLRFDNRILSGGQYSFNSFSGPIFLFLPKDTSCSLEALFGVGGFKSDFAFPELTRDNTPQGQRLRGSIGSGDATLSLTTVNGFIRLVNKK